MENFPHPPTLILVAAAVVALVFILNRWLFGPLNEILAKRQSEVDEARAEFERAKEVQDQRIAEVEARLAEARKQAYGVREKAIQEGRAQRDDVLAEARAETMERVEAAKQEIQDEVEGARRQLEEDARSIAKRIAEQLLGRPVSSGGDS